MEWNVMEWHGMAFFELLPSSAPGVGRVGLALNDTQKRDSRGLYVTHTMQQEKAVKQRNTSANIRKH